MRSLSFFLLFGCAEYDLGVNAEAGDDTGRYATPDTALEDTSDSALPADPAWYVVRADLSVVGGVASPEAATVAIDVIDADLERVNCVVDLAADLVTGATAETEPDSDAVWWDVPVRSDAAPCAILPDTLQLGVGALHPDVRARLGAVGHDDIADSLYGAWLRADGGAVTVYGYAGTATDLFGDDVAVLPPPDGLYRLAPLYVVALPD
ncbi:MAG: hypothetical protein V4850_21390 [Myxococcota bacterium]